MSGKDNDWCQEPTKVHIVKAMVFPVGLYGYESWTIKKAECWRTDAFELWCWRILLRVPWAARRSNQSILKEISPEYSLEELMLKLQYFGHLMWRADSLEKTLMLGKIEDRRRKGQQRMRWLVSITDSVDMNLSKLWEIVEDRGAWRAAEHGVAKSQTWLSDWTIKQEVRQGSMWNDASTDHCACCFFTWTMKTHSDLEMCLLRQWHPTPVLLPGKSHGRRSLIGCSPWGR